MGNILDKIEGTSSKTGDPCVEIASVIFKAITDAHITHLLNKDKTFAKHNAMSIFYDEMPDILDGFIETYMGLYSVTSITVPASNEITDAISYFKGIYDKIEVLRKDIKESFLQSPIDTIQESIAHALYRLKNIQS